MAAVVRTWRRRPRPNPIWSAGVWASGGAGVGCDLVGLWQWPWTRAARLLLLLLAAVLAGQISSDSGLALGVPVWMWAATEWWWLMAMVRAVPRRRPVRERLARWQVGCVGGWLVLAPARL